MTSCGLQSNYSCTAGQLCYIPLGRHQVNISNVMRSYSLLKQLCVVLNIWLFLDIYMTLTLGALHRSVLALR